MPKKVSKVDPWEVSGGIDYGKLVDEFGVKPMPKMPEALKKHVFFRRGIVFAHRDFEKIVERIKKRRKFAMMTGLMPSGKFHLGHMMVALQMIMYQKLGAKLYVTVADLESYSTRQKSFEESKKTAIEEYLKNYIALGLKPKNLDFYFQSNRSDEARKSNAYYRLASGFSRCVSFKEFKAVYGEITPGKMNSSLVQASDMFHPQLPEFEGKIPVVVPVGIDQDPHLRIARDMGSRYKDYDFVQLSSTYHKFFPSLKGGGKMSSSDEISYVAMTDSEKEVENKINKHAFSGGGGTLEEHRKRGGDPEKDVPFQYLKTFFEPDDGKLEDVEESYRSGEMLTSELKQILVEKINAFLKKHQSERKKAEKRIDRFI